MYEIAKDGGHNFVNGQRLEINGERGESKDIKSVKETLHDALSEVII